MIPTINLCFYLAYRYLSCVVTAVGNRSNIFVMELEARFSDLNHYELRSASEPDGIPKMLELFSDLPSWKSRTTSNSSPPIPFPFSSLSLSSRRLGLFLFPSLAFWPSNSRRARTQAYVMEAGAGLRYEVHILHFCADVYFQARFTGSVFL